MLTLNFEVVVELLAGVVEFFFVWRPVVATGCLPLSWEPEVPIRSTSFFHGPTN